MTETVSQAAEAAKTAVTADVTAAESAARSALGTAETDAQADVAVVKGFVESHPVLAGVIVAAAFAAGALCGHVIK